VFEFDLAWAFVLLPLPLLAWWLLPPYREKRQSVQLPFFERISTAVGAKPAKGGMQARRTIIQKVFAVAGWALIVTALARPQFVELPIEKIESARDLLLAVDLSGSMATADMLDPQGSQIDRVTAVKLVLDDFIKRRVGDRIGITVFGNQAFLQAPFTQDHELVRTLLDQMQPKMAGSQTMLGDAIGLAINVFENSIAKDRLVVLLTDGKDSGSKVPPKKAAEIAAERGLTIHTVSVGDPASTGEGEMDIETLEEIARLTGGHSFQADDREQLEQIYRRIDELAPIEIETISFRPIRPLFHWPLGAAISLVLLYHLLMAIGQVARFRKERHA
jgi:Ca-activated chloride channel family protein